VHQEVAHEAVVQILARALIKYVSCKTLWNKIKLFFLN
jgi:hypothetical protein